MRMSTRTILLAVGLVLTWAGLGTLAFASTTYCNGKITYFPEGGWSFGCDGECPSSQVCMINRQPGPNGYANVCACDQVWITACCHLVGVVEHHPGQPDTIVAAKAGQCNPPNAGCPPGVCSFILGEGSGGEVTFTAECD